MYGQSIFSEPFGGANNIFISGNGVPTLQISNTSGVGEIDMNLTAFTGGIGFRVNSAGATFDMPINANAGCVGCSSAPFAVDQFQIGTGTGTSSFFTAPTGALAYKTFGSGSQGLSQAGASDLSNGVNPGSSGTVPLTANSSVTGWNLNSFSFTAANGTGTGAAEIKLTATASACDAPTAGANINCAPPASVVQEQSVDGSTMATQPIPLVATGNSTASTTGAAISGLTSGTIRAGQGVIGRCFGVYAIATAVAVPSFGVIASQTPQSVTQSIQMGGNTTNGANSIQNSSATSANAALIANHGSVSLINTNYNFYVDFYILWNASTSGTFDVRMATSAGADQISVPANGAACQYQLLN